MFAGVAEMPAIVATVAAVAVEIEIPMAAPTPGIANVLATIATAPRTVAAPLSTLLMPATLR